MHIPEILELNERAKEEARRYPRKRPLYTVVQRESGRHFTGIVGPRGVGKTVLLKQLALSDPGACYISADAIEEPDLFNISKILSDQLKIKTLLIDEIHFCRTYAKDLKRIYDFFNVRVVFTSSVSLSLFDTAHDLSRRVLLRFLYPFSFREFLSFAKGTEIPALTIDDIVDGRWTAEHMRFDYLFDDYLQGRLFPFSLEEPDCMPMLGNICSKIAHRDIPMVSNLRMEDIQKIEKAVAFIGKSDVDGINFSSISRNLGITKYKAEQYVGLLAKAFVLNPIYPIGTNVLREPKVLMYLPFRLLYKDWDQCIGAIREDFCAEMLTMCGYRFHYLKTKRGAKTPDFHVVYGNKRLVVEIGGKGKGREQFKGIKIEKKLILTHSAEAGTDKRPLSLLGFLEPTEC